MRKTTRIIAEDGDVEIGDSKREESVFRIRDLVSEVACEPNPLYTQACQI